MTGPSSDGLAERVALAGLAHVTEAGYPPVGEAVARHGAP
ncbi:MAG: hypothetical protein JWN08_1829, partial [Frankiales bacterium]|nr:hypothetical protein [Frankiales bacterium]